MGFLQLLKLFLSILPEVLTVVRAVEIAVPKAGQGAAKLETVLSVVEAVALTAPTIVSSVDAIKTSVKVGDIPTIAKGLSHMITSVVSLFNKTGAFQKAGIVQANAPDNSNAL